MMKNSVCVCGRCVNKRDSPVSKIEDLFCEIGLSFLHNANVIETSLNTPWLLSCETLHSRLTLRKHIRLAGLCELM